MKRPITMPALSDTMNNGRLIKWLKQPGDAIKSGDAIAEVETDKAVMEVEAFHDGYLAAPLAAVNAELPVGQTIGFIADTLDEAASSPSLAAAPPTAPPVAAAEAMPKTVRTAPSLAAAPSVRLANVRESDSPRARARARHGIAGVEVLPRPAAEPARKVPETAVAASRTAAVPHITTADAIDPAIAEGPPYRIERAPGMREAVAHNVMASAATPTFRVTAKLSLEPLRALAAKEDISFTVLLARACAAVISAHPLFNAAFTPRGLAFRERIDIGIAVDGPDALFTPVLRDVATRRAAELCGDWRSLLGKAKARRLSLSDYRGATFYLSNLGTFPVVESFDSVVPGGASAILSVSASQADGTRCTLNCDHRVVFGADAARFLQTLGEVLANPDKLL